MNTKDLFRKLSSLVIFIFLTNFVANKLHLYYSIWWFDMVMHFMGGAWLGLVFVWFESKKNLPIILNSSLVLKVVAWILLVGIGWEFFEYYFINYMAQNNFDIIDTMSDLVLDLSGGLLVTIYFARKYFKNNIELQ